MPLGRIYESTTPITDTVLDGDSGSLVNAGTPTRNSANIDVSDVYGIDFICKADETGTATPTGIVEFLLFGGLTSTVADHATRQIATTSKINLATVDPQGVMLSICSPMPPHLHIQFVRHSGTVDMYGTLTYLRWMGDPDAAFA